MNRWGYGILAVLVVALAVYLITTPDAPKDRFSQVWEGETPKDFILKSPGLEQQVSGGIIKIGELSRPTDASEVRRLWQVLSSMRADRYTEVNPADLSAYGIGEWGISADNIDLRWGMGNGQSYVYNGSRGEVAIMNDGVFPSLVRVATRLDINQLVDPTLTLQAVVYDNARYVPDVRGEWYQDAGDDRPPVSVRIQALENLVQAIRLTDFELPAASAQELTEAEQRFVLEYKGQKSSDVVIFSRDSEFFIQIGTLPVQPITPALRRSFNEALADFSSDPLFDLRSVSTDPRILRAEVWRDGEWWFTLDSEMDSFDNERRYSVLWSGGRDDVDARGPWWFQDGFNALMLETVTAVDDTALSIWQEEHTDSEPYLHIRAWGQDDVLLADLHLRGEHVRNRRYQGRLKQVPDFLQDIGPNFFLKRRLLSVDEARLAKFQRVQYDENETKPEVFRQVTGEWQQVIPKGQTVNGLVLQRVIGSILVSESESVEIGHTRQGQKPSLSIALRINGKAVDDDRFEVDLIDTIDRDWGLDFFQREDGKWDAVLADSSATYLLSDDLVQAWFESAQAFPVLPVLANEISSMRIRLADQERYDLRRGASAEWQIRIGDTALQKAEDIEVRRFLADLIALNALRQDKEAAILGLNERQHSMTLFLSRGGADVDRLILSIGPTVETGNGSERVLSVHREGVEPAAWGRFWVDAVTFDALLAPARRFLPLESSLINE